MRGPDMFFRALVCICFLFFPVFMPAAAVFSQDFPLQLTFANLTAVKEKHHHYGALNGLKKQYYGEYWEEKYTFSDKLANADRFALMSDTILHLLNNSAHSFTRYGYLEFEYDGQSYAMKLDAYAKTATIKLTRRCAYSPFLSLQMADWPMDAKLSAKVGDVPLLPVAPYADELEVTGLKYKNYEEKQFRTKGVTIDAKGKFWEIRYALKKYNKHNLLRYRATHNYRDLLAKQGARISMDGDAGFIFSLDYKGRHYAGDFAAYDSTAELKIIEEDAFKQTLVLSPDKLKSQLDAKGKVTLQGIYFDTNKATLKKESNSAILAAASLLKQYGDLILEVQGHTDSQGDDAYNLELSAQRAESVVKALVAEGVEKTRLVSKGFGEKSPVADNATKEGRAQNRRVELHRISGGNEMTMISIDFIKPLPGAVLEAKRHYSEGELTVHHTPPWADKKHVETVTASDYDVCSYIIERDGKTDTSLGPTEIIANYRNILPMLGAQLLGEYQSRIYFAFEDRGDRRTLFGVIAAYTGQYEVRVYLLD